LNLRDDIYGLDAAILKLMRGGERQIADTPIPRNYGSSSKPVVARLRARPARAFRQGAVGITAGTGISAENSYAAYPSVGVRYSDRAINNW
jgi:hypothetical protein